VRWYALAALESPLLSPAFAALMTIALAGVDYQSRANRP